MKSKKPAKRAITLKSDKSFDELIEDAFNDKVFKKDKVKTVSVLTMLTIPVKRKKKLTKKAAKKSKKK